MDDEDYRAQISNAYPLIDFSGILGLPDHEPCLSNKENVQRPIFCGHGNSTVWHIIYFLSFVGDDLNTLHQDILMQVFVNILKKDAWIWYCGLPCKCIFFFQGKKA